MRKIKISVIGMGYVGLPLAVSLSQFFEVVGFDINDERIGELKEGIDRTNEISSEELTNADSLFLTSQERDLSSSNVYIVTVPTPIDGKNKPDLFPIKSASKLVGSFLSKGDTVIYEYQVNGKNFTNKIGVYNNSIKGLKEAFEREWKKFYSRNC